MSQGAGGIGLGDDSEGSRGDVPVVPPSMPPSSALPQESLQRPPDTSGVLRWLLCSSTLEHGPLPEKGY